MGTATTLKHLFRNLFHHTMWKYAVLWKLHHESHMLLAYEEAYAIDSSYIQMVVSNITSYSYLLGEGVVGEVAVLGKHKWFSFGESNSKSLLECHEELQLQVLAGIKTILLLPLLPIGVLQLGSLDELSEDLRMVSQLMDLILHHQYTLDSPNTVDLRMDQIDSTVAPSYLAVATDLSASNHSQPQQPDVPTLTVDSEMKSDFLLTAFDLLPPVMVQTCHNKIRGDAVCTEQFPYHSKGQSVLNSYSITGTTMGTSSDFLHNEEEVRMIPQNGQASVSENSIMFDYFINEVQQHGYDVYHINNSYAELPKLGNECNTGIDSTSEYLNFSIDLEPYEAIRYSSHSLLEVPESVGSLVPEHGAFMEESRKEGQLDGTKAVLCSELGAKELESSKYIRYCSCSTDSSVCCLGRCRAEDVSGSEESALDSHQNSSLFPSSEDFAGYFSNNASTSSICNPIANREQENILFGFQESCPKASYSCRKQPRYRKLDKTRPRDRKLIQDRIKELRELIPNASKCSISALLERTINHFIFLQSVPTHADRLSRSRNSKDEGGDYSIHGGSTWAGNTGIKSKAFPLIIENLDQPDQMLLEMRCKNYILFIEIVQAVKRLGLTILKGVLESRSDELWAHFILEVPKGFHRLEIIWPLLQLLQIKL
ncbi:Transcription factor LHW [Apostasia shenzhenica]|uniref:Transcription factor LHW n=1 Tax=Apostasia shenzhenica TaxID=1088818 RepID=A0A2H9ZS45_9ASPA|nr:Transcription factor LHW [Apostasia shenzhenica]